MKNPAGVTLLITHYNRSRSLERLLKKLRELTCHFDEIIVSDDASRPEHIERLRELQKEYSFRLLTTPVNRGLGNNINKGQDAVTTPYTLYVQEDFLPTDAFPEGLRAALEIMETRKDIDMIRLYVGLEYPDVKPYKFGFSEMIFRLSRPGSAKFFYYSDTPHLRRRDFFQKFGRYAEGVVQVKGEKYMGMAFLQAHGKAMLTDKNDLFVHENPDEEPSTQDYSAFNRMRAKIPEPIFDALWTVKKTVEYLFIRYRR
ncbi:MAG: glycosyltransferase family 2 protein [Polyangiaceae bacterium]|nr:glycosyltransferase family 2 protein [Polyangiaceae bacterium]